MAAVAAPTLAAAVATPTVATVAPADVVAAVPSAVASVAPLASWCRFLVLRFFILAVVLILRWQLRAGALLLLLDDGRRDGYLYGGRVEWLGRREAAVVRA